MSKSLGLVYLITPSRASKTIESVDIIFSVRVHASFTQDNLI